MKKSILAVAALTLGMATPAHAAHYIFDVSINGTTGSGVFETSGDARNTYALITSLTGVFGGKNMVLSAPGTAPYLPSNDNKFTENGMPFTFGGLAFAAGPKLYNIYSSGSQLLTCIPHKTCSASTTFSATAINDVAPVPEPATWIILILGFAAVGLKLRQRNDQRITLQFA
ncbi:MAG: PEPxxWA-CTERM sorting domain-containing protein [Sphingomonadaceae bacterium]